MGPPHALDPGSAGGDLLAVERKSSLRPLLVAAALLLRLRLAATLSFLITGAVSTTLYLHNYHRPLGHGNPISSIRAPLEIFQYIATYFGSPWCPALCSSGNLHWNRWLGGRVFRALPLSRIPSSRPSLSGSACADPGVLPGAAFITSLGRLNFGIRQAFASRYHTFALLFWCCLGLLLLMSESVTENKRVRFLVVQLCILGIIVWSSHITRNDVRGARLRGFEINVAATAMFVGGYDEVQFAKAAITNPRAVPSEAQFLQKNGLSAYADNAYAQLGKPLQSVYALAPSEERTGLVESAATVEGNGQSRAVRIAGWGRGRQHQRPPSAIVMTEDDIIAGLGVVGVWRPMTLVDNRRIKDGYIGYAGYARVVQLDAPLKMYAILRGNPQSACYLRTVESPERP